MKKMIAAAALTLAASTATAAGDLLAGRFVTLHGLCRKTLPDGRLVLH